MFFASALPGLSVQTRAQVAATSPQPVFDKCGDNPALARQLLALLGSKWGYGYDSLLVDLTRWRQHPAVRIDSVGASVQNRTLWQLTLTSPEPVSVPRRTVFIHARTHPGEVQGWWVTNALIDLLLSDDPFARFVLERCVFYILPMYNPDGVELEHARTNANNIDIESNWASNPVQPEVAVLRRRFSELQASAAPIEVALNMHAAFACRRYFVYHDAAGTSVPFTALEQNFIGGVRAYFADGIEPWSYFVSWTSGTPAVYPESWFWFNYRKAVMALTYEDMNCAAAGEYDRTAYALLHGIADYLGLVATAVLTDAGPPVDFTLAQSYPNPVRAAGAGARPTVILYRLAVPLRVRLAVYDLLGRQVALLDEGVRAAGAHRVFFDTSRFPAGRYFYRLETAAGALARPFTVLR